MNQRTKQASQFVGDPSILEASMEARNVVNTCLITVPCYSSYTLLVQGCQNFLQLQCHVA